MMDSRRKKSRHYAIVVRREVPPPEEEVQDQVFPSSIISGLLTSDPLRNEQERMAIKKPKTDFNLSPPPTTTNSNKVIQMGETFSSFAEVLSAIRMYESKNKVSLTQKYFRRIAANPKPSNKEDYSLSVEERKRFVYRWVDFCCTYFDSFLSRSDISDEGAAPPAIGFTIKECPMRIRFQIRFQEKDLIVSICRETHDHTHPAGDDPLRPTPTKDGSGGATELSNHVPKQNLRPPPSLAPLPNRHASGSTSSFLSPLSSFQNKKNPQSPLPQSISSTVLKLPRPPPLKGPGMVIVPSTKPPSIPSTTHLTVTTTAASVSEDNSSKIIIRNIYNFLLRTKMHRRNGDGNTNGIVITSQNPDLVKLTSEMTGIDQRIVREIVSGRSTVPTKLNSSQQRLSFNASSTTERSSILSMDPRSDVSNKRIAKRSHSQNSVYLEQTKINRPDFNDSDSADGWTPYFNSNTESCDTYKKLANLPLDITIKPEITSYENSEEDDDYAMDFNDEDQDSYYNIQNNFNGR